MKRLPPFFPLFSDDDRKVMRHGSFPPPFVLNARLPFLPFFSFPRRLKMAGCPFLLSPRRWRERQAPFSLHRLAIDPTTNFPIPPSERFPFPFYLGEIHAVLFSFTRQTARTLRHTTSLSSLTALKRARIPSFHYAVLRKE